MFFFYFNIGGKLSLNDAIDNVSEWLRTGSNPSDNNRLQSHGKILKSI